MIFNTDKTVDDYKNGKLFFNPPAGLVDTIHQRFPRVWELFEQMRSYDWSWNEFDFSQCLVDFKTVNPDTADMMLKTLLWQWEADSVASRAPTVIIAPYSPATEVWAAEQRITDNEMVHAATYSEIVRTGMPFPHKIIQQMIDEADTFRRLDTLNTELSKIAEASAAAQYSGTWDSRALHKLIMFYFCMLCLERIQFMSSFSITFTICKSGAFQAIGKAVQKIAQDELEVHCEYRKEIIKELIKMPGGKEALEELKPTMSKIFHEIVESEFAWTDSLFDGRSITGTNADIVKKWVLFCAKDVARYMKLESEYTFPKENPMPHLEEWFTMNAVQAAPQEEQLAQYKVGIVNSTTEENEYEV